MKRPVKVTQTNSITMTAPDSREGQVQALVIQSEHYAAAGFLPPLPVAGSGERVAKDIFAAIKDYSQYDCLSTWKLRDWLLDLAR